MKVVKGELFVFVLSFVSDKDGKITIPLEVAWTQVWSFGDTKLYRLERYDKAGNVVQDYLKTTEEIRAGLITDDNALDEDVADFG